MENYMKIFLLFLFLIQSVGYAEINAIEEEILADNIRNFYKVSDGIYRSAQPDRKKTELNIKTAMYRENRKENFFIGKTSFDIIVLVRQPY